MFKFAAVIAATIALCLSTASMTMAGPDLHKRAGNHLDNSRGCAEQPHLFEFLKVLTALVITTKKSGSPWRLAGTLDQTQTRYLRSLLLADFPEASNYTTYKGFIAKGVALVLAGKRIKNPDTASGRPTFTVCLLYSLDDFQAERILGIAPSRFGKGRDL
jgi:hypothetical protein